MAREETVAGTTPATHVGVDAALPGGGRTVVSIGRAHGRTTRFYDTARSLQDNLRIGPRPATDPFARWEVTLDTRREVQRLATVLSLKAVLQDGGPAPRRYELEHLIPIEAHGAVHLFADTVRRMLREIEAAAGERIQVEALVSRFILERTQAQIDDSIHQLWACVRDTQYGRPRRTGRDGELYIQTSQGWGHYEMGYGCGHAAASGSGGTNFFDRITTGRVGGPIHRRRGDQTISIGTPDRASERKATVLFYKTIGKAAFRRYRRKGYHDVLGPKSGVWYRLKKGAMIDVISGQHAGCRLCVGPRDPVPSTDIMMSQLVTILGDEEELWKVANHWPGGGPGAHWSRKTKCRQGGSEY